MITKITELNQLKYEDLFMRAWQELWYRGYFDNRENELRDYYPANTFTTLEDYFTKIETLIKPEANATYPATIKQWTGEELETVSNPKYIAGESNLIQPNYEFIMFPIDEPRFEINAETREITIPNNFKKLVGIQGDHVAETLIFSIDRFVDYYDLLPTNVNQMKIYAQWKTAKDIDMLSPITMIHYEAKTQKILFGWPLTFNVTNEPRVIDFSIRFIVQQPNDDVTYSLNTKTHQITIVKALQPTITSTMARDTAANSFLNAIKNSPSTDAPPAAVPSFAAPGTDLPATKDIEPAGDELKVQAIVNGLGNLRYTRWTKDGTPVTGGTLAYRTTTDTTRVANKKYYTETGTGTGIYKIYTGDIADPNKDVCEQFYIFAIPSRAENIVGTYKAYVVNETSKNVSPEIESTACVIPGPGPITYAPSGDLLASATPSSSTVSAVDLSVNVNQTKAEDVLEYTWEYDDANEDMSSATTITSATGATCTIDTATNPGYYRVTVTPIRNRASGASIVSTTCRVTEFPKVPALRSITAEKGTVKDDGKIDIDNVFGTILTAELDPASKNLVRDSFEYKWHGVLEGGTPIEITAENKDDYRVKGINGNLIEVYGGDEDKPITYNCTVRNNLNGKASEFSALNTAIGIKIY